MGHKYTKFGRNSLFHNSSFSGITDFAIQKEHFQRYRKSVITRKFAFLHQSTKFYIGCYFDNGHNDKIAVFMRFLYYQISVKAMNIP